jgi:acetyltransferase-like isoleucine patch superfamily enzyme
VVVSGGVQVGDNTFLGVNSTLVNDISVGSDCWIGPAVTLTRDAPPGSFYTPAKSTLRDESALDRFLTG